MKLRKVMGIMLSAALAAGMITGCSGSGKTAETKAAQTPAAETQAAGEAAETPAAEAAGAAADSKWPEGNVSIYVPAKAGGGTDMIARLFVQAVADQTGTGVVVVNDETGGGTVAAEKIRNSRPDGLNLFYPNTGFCGAIASGQYQHTFDDFTIIALATTPSNEGSALFVKADSPFETLEDFISYAKEHPGELVGSIETNKAAHNVTILFQKEVGIECTLVDGGGNADRITSLMGGMNDFSIMNTTNTSQYVDSGDLRCLAVMNDVRSTLCPDAPTLTELGYKSVDLPMCAVLCGPADMSEADIAKICSVMEAASQDPTLQEGLQKLGTAWEFKNHEESIEFVHEIQALYDDAFKLR